MPINVAISGFGRIGRLVLRALYETKRKDIKIVAINCSRGDIDRHAHLIKFDTAHGRFNAEVSTSKDSFINSLSHRHPGSVSFEECQARKNCDGATSNGKVLKAKSCLLANDFVQVSTMSVPLRISGVTR